MVSNYQKPIFSSNQLYIIKKSMESGLSDSDIAARLGLKLDVYLEYLEMYNTNISKYSNGNKEKAEGR